MRDRLAGTQERRLRSGDVSYFEELFRSFYRPLLSYSAPIVGDWEVAEDVVQGVFERLWKERKRLEMKTTMRSYLFQCVYSRSLDVLRKEKVRREYRERSLVKVNAGESETLGNITYPELESRVRSAVERLPAQCRRVFEKSRYAGMSNADIAEDLGISVKTVEVHMSKALKRLRSDLGDFLILCLFYGII
ncbi:DNA-directed RNA polymerase sigma-70 factor [Fulvitalea axinellae]|uniref:DNA-directed RNA polymerase sigma-70 factor n=1 Tax=Fulvitalea axinellae TaxID=1182444 RepID=A0AAU9C6K5_9BACT|nr:DNA-directed RNA polymerase sigma-70 factor [Fulvitalea axinellae]